MTVARVFMIMDPSRGLNILSLLSSAVNDPGSSQNSQWATGAETKVLGSFDNQHGER